MKLDRASLGPEVVVAAAAAAVDGEAAAAAVTVVVVAAAEGAVAVAGVVVAIPAAIERPVIFSDREVPGHDFPTLSFLARSWRFRSA
jgi:hypothetical protein